MVNKRNEHKVYENLKIRGHLEDTDTYVRTILKCILNRNKYVDCIYLAEDMDK